MTEARQTQILQKQYSDYKAELTAVKKAIRRGILKSKSKEYMTILDRREKMLSSITRKLKNRLLDTQTNFK